MNKQQLIEKLTRLKNVCQTNPDYASAHAMVGLLTDLNIQLLESLDELVMERLTNSEDSSELIGPTAATSGEVWNAPTVESSNKLLVTSEEVVAASAKAKDKLLKGKK